MKGIILAGGSGTRLYPVTLPVCKQLLPVYDKPMVYYPLSVLMLSGIREILIISTPQDIGRFEELFGDGRQLGLKIQYAVQEVPRGLAEALIIGEQFLDGDSCAMILGDNIFYGHGLTDILIKARQSVEKNGGAEIFGYYVPDPQRYGVVGFDASGKVTSIVEKPEKPASHYAALGLYFFDGDAAKVAREVKPSDRGEIEITAVNQHYLKEGKLRVNLLGRGFAWFDTGTHDSLLEAGDFVCTIEKRTGLKVGCIEEIAHSNKFINDDELIQLAEPLKKSGYGQYLMKLLEGGVAH
ncbi:MAG: glucose-1-phosphate thymidylyltransferase RfbA [Candidatus Berkelbacteria bacterium]|nr:glucose-1-phosphate thymidylyltransferase RfbA [Candidatus Berkelbacteria bacterium]